MGDESNQLDVRRSRESGFTVVEAIIALLLTSLVVGFAYSSYTFLSHRVAQWKTRTALENTVHLIVRDWSQQARRAVEVQRDDARWTFVALEGSTTTYRHEGTTLRKNDRQMHEPPVDVVDVSLERVEVDRARTAFGGDPSRMGPEPGGSSGHRRLQFLVTAATQTDTIAIRTSVSFRQPQLWSTTSTLREDADSSP